MWIMFGDLNRWPIEHKKAASGKLERLFYVPPLLTEGE
jgi:hypothetical protein